MDLEIRPSDFVQLSQEAHSFLRLYHIDIIRLAVEIFPIVYMLLRFHILQMGQYPEFPAVVYFLSQLALEGFGDPNGAVLHHQSSDPFWGTGAVQMDFFPVEGKFLCSKQFLHSVREGTQITVGGKGQIVGVPGIGNPSAAGLRRQLAVQFTKDKVGQGGTGRRALGSTPS